MTAITRGEFQVDVGMELFGSRRRGYAVAIAGTVLLIAALAIIIFKLVESSGISDASKIAANLNWIKGAMGIAIGVIFAGGIVCYAERRHRTNVRTAGDESHLIEYYHRIPYDKPTTEISFSPLRENDKLYNYVSHNHADRLYDQDED